MYADMVKIARGGPSHPEIRDIEIKWLTYPPPPLVGSEGGPNLFEVTTTAGNGEKSQVTLTRIQAVAVADAIFPRSNG